MARRKKIGQVVSDKMDKTIIVAVEGLKEHPLYHKKYKVIKKYKVHDPKNSCQVNDEVAIEETRPLSRQKTWRLVKILKSPQRDKSEQK